MATAINTELVLLYWNIGRIIKSDILQDTKAEYDKQTVEGLSNRLVSEFGRGYSTKNLFNMIKFFEVFNDEKIFVSGKIKYSKNGQ